MVYGLFMSEKRCVFPGCQSAVPVKAGPGRKSSYCADAEHNAVSAFRARKAGEVAEAAVGAQESGDRLVSLAGSRLRLVAEGIGETLAKQRAWMDAETSAVVDALADLHDLEKVEAELAAVRA
jgi:colicin import membrane protein